MQQLVHSCGLPKSLQDVHARRVNSYAVATQKRILHVEFSHSKTNSFLADSGRTTHTLFACLFVYFFVAAAFVKFKKRCKETTTINAVFQTLERATIYNEIKTEGMSLSLLSNLCK